VNRIALAVPDELVDAIARRVVELLHEQGRPSAGEYLTAAEFAERHHLSRSTVYARAEELGAIRVGRAIRFPPDASPAHEPETLVSAEPQPKPARRQRGGSVDLLPIRDRQAA